MGDATRQRAFEQFYRSADARRLAPDGSGVGLYAARGLMRAMGGDITIQSRLGAGATITLTLPAEQAAETTQAAGAAQAGGAEEAGVASQADHRRQAG
jgi:signal transduction histidine kinase